MNTYSTQSIAMICEEIERHWEYHLLTRAAFPADAVNATPAYSSRPYYHYYGVDLQVIFKNPDSPLIQRALKGVPHWLNQNFIIRLFGLLDEYKVITAGKRASNRYTAIVAALRHMVGAHSSGYPNPERNEFREVTELIKSHLDPSVDLDSVRDFHLNIQTVLRPLKDECIAFVRSLQGQQIPTKGPSAQSTGG